jgi:hypothetical protein
VTTRRQIQLPAPYPPINIAETNPDTGRDPLPFQSPRAAGTIPANPELRGAEPIPTAVHLKFGEHATRDHERPHRPVINSVTLTPAAYLALDTRPSGCTAQPAPAPAPAATMLSHARPRPGCCDFISPQRTLSTHAAARRTAHSRLHQLHRPTIDPSRTGSTNSSTNASTTSTTPPPATNSPANATPSTPTPRRPRHDTHPATRQHTSPIP